MDAVARTWDREKRRQYNRTYYLAHREEALAKKAAERRAAPPLSEEERREKRERRNVWAKAYRERNRDKIRAQKRKYEIEHREANRERLRRYCAEHPERVRDAKRRSALKRREHRRVVWRERYWRDIETSRERSRNRARKYGFRYGLTRDAYYRLLEAQGGVCAICHQVQQGYISRYGHRRRLAIDHDHVTGRVRGLLCTSCNQALGIFRDDPARLDALVQYLVRS